MVKHRHAAAGTGSPPAEPSSGPAEVVSRIADEYRGDEDLPLGGFVAAMTAYGAAVAGLSVVVRRRHGLPERLRAEDLLLAGIATHKASRLLTRAAVTSPLRAPFTRFVGSAGPAELEEEVRGEGPRRAVGELLSCPFCLGQWLATGFTFGLVLAPRPTRTAASALAVAWLSDVLQFAQAALVERTS